MQPTVRNGSKSDVRPGCPQRVESRQSIWIEGLDVEWHPLAQITGQLVGCARGVSK